MDPKNRIIVALDVSTLREAGQLVKKLSPHVWGFKVGLHLIISVGAPKVVRFLQNLGCKVFLDGKFHDIPNTMSGAAGAASALGAEMFTVHASSDIEGMRAAVEKSGIAQVIAVTVLTSLEENNANLIYGAPSKAKVLQFARYAKMAGCAGIVCSPQELEFLGRQKELEGLLKITPGVRPEWAEAGDQKRVMTPGEAILAGAGALVIGRPITKPPAKIGVPAEAARLIGEEIAEALSRKK